MSVDFYRESPGKLDLRTLSRKTLNRWTGRIVHVWGLLVFQFEARGPLSPDLSAKLLAKSSHLKTEKVGAYNM